MIEFKEWTELLMPLLDKIDRIGETLLRIEDKIETADIEEFNGDVLAGIYDMEKKGREIQPNVDGASRTSMDTYRAYDDGGYPTPELMRIISHMAKGITEKMPDILVMGESKEEQIEVVLRIRRNVPMNRYNCRSSKDHCDQDFYVDELTSPPPESSSHSSESKP